VGATSGEELTNYLLSVPERALRSATALGAGLLREIGDVAVPSAVRRGKLYRSLVDSTLRFLIEQVGQVEGAYPSEGKLTEDFAVRRAAGNGLELIGILAFRASPVWVLAVLADLSGAGRKLIREIAEELKREGLLDPAAGFETVDQMLDGLEKSAGRAADAINTPPLNVAELRAEWAAIREQFSDIRPLALPSPDLLSKNWDEIRDEARRQHRSVFEISSLMALAAASRLPENLRWLGRSARLAARRTGQFFAGPLLDHYSRAIVEIRHVGFLEYWTREFRPYLSAAAAQFSPSRRSLTEKWLRRSGR
jgi:hypothetical protein